MKIEIARSPGGSSVEVVRSRCWPQLVAAGAVECLEARPKGRCPEHFTTGSPRSSARQRCVAVPGAALADEGGVSHSTKACPTLPSQSKAKGPKKHQPNNARARSAASGGSPANATRRGRGRRGACERPVLHRLEEPPGRGENGAQRAAVDSNDPEGSGRRADGLPVPLRKRAAQRP